MVVAYQLGTKGKTDDDSLVSHFRSDIAVGDTSRIFTAVSLKKIAPEWPRMYARAGGDGKKLGQWEFPSLINTMECGN